jgi:tRNA A-37 threonylcarbamoyl transferase component Bud32
MARLTRTVILATALARKTERDWQRLCNTYLPVQLRNSIWRFSRKLNRNDPSQGWKLHVSATPLSACRIFRAIAPYLKRSDFAFKALKSLVELAKLNAGVFYGFSQVGKFITVYPPSTDAAIAIAIKLDALVGNEPAPFVPYDNPLRHKSCIYYRYGGFSNRTMTFRGKRIPAIAHPDGKLMPDFRTPGAAVPPWLTDPFEAVRSQAVSACVTQLETTYRNYEALVQRGKGGVYRALDLSFRPPKLCIIREGRRHGETDWLGHDGFDRIKREAQFLRLTSSVIAALPRITTTFRANGCFYLVLKPIAGRSLQQIIASRERISTRGVLKYCTNMARIVADIHAAGWAWLDCKPANFLCQKNQRLRPLDFESVSRLNKAPLRQLWRSPGYVPPVWRENSGDSEAADLYALGTSMMQLIARSNSPTKLTAAFQREMRRRKLPGRLVKIIRNLRNPRARTQLPARATQQALEEMLRNFS